MLDLDGLVVGPCMDVFGEPVLYYGAGATATPIQGVYDEAYLALQPLGSNQPGLGPLAMGAMPNITAATPVLGIRAADVPEAPAQGDRLTVRGQDFQVREVQADGHGWAKLLLNAAAALP